MPWPVAVSGRARLIGVPSPAVPAGAAFRYALDEASGSALDTSGNGLTLPAINAPLGATGKILTARHFVSASAQALGPATVAALGNLGSFGLSCWVNLDTTALLTVFQGFITLRTAADAAIIATLAYTGNTTHLYRFQVNGLTPNVIDATTFGAPAAGAWHLVNAWYDAVGATLNIQVDNGTVNSVAVTGTPTQDAAPKLYLGQRAAATGNLDGLLDGVWGLPRALTAGDRTQLWNGGAGVQ